MSTHTFVVSVLLLAFGSTACDNAGAGRITTLDATATVVGSVFVDRNGSRVPDPNDTPAGSIVLSLVLAGAFDTVATATTGNDGIFVFPEVPVGRYIVALPQSTLADSFRVTFRDPPGQTLEDGLSTQLPPPSPITLGDSDTLRFTAGIGFPRVSVSEARSAAPGTRLFGAGTALTRINEFGDGNLYIRGPGAAIRATRVQPTVLSVGDSLHVLGTTAVPENQPVLRDARPFIVDFGPAPEPRIADQATARTASNGALDSDLVRTDSLTVADTTRVGARFRIRSTAAEPLHVMIHPDGSYDFTRFGPGSVLEVTGILIEEAQSGVWRLWPRSSADVVVLTPAP